MRVKNENVKTSFGQLRQASGVVQNDSRLYNSYPSNYFDRGETFNSSKQCFLIYFIWNTVSIKNKIKAFQAF